MSDKIVKALFRQHKHPMKNRERTRCLGQWWFERLWFSFKRFLLPSFPRPDSRVVIARRQKQAHHFSKRYQWRSLYQAVVIARHEAISFLLSHNFITQPFLTRQLRKIFIYTSFPIKEKGTARRIEIFDAALACLGQPPKGYLLFLGKKKQNPRLGTAVG